MKTKEQGLDPKSNDRISKINVGVSVAFSSALQHVFHANRGLISFSECIEAMVTSGYFPGAKTKAELQLIYEQLEKNWFRSMACDPLTPQATDYE